MLAVESLFIDSMGSSPTLSKSSAATDNNRSILAPTDGLSLASHPETAATDNKCTIAQVKPVGEQPQEFCQALREKIVPQGTQENQGQRPLEDKSSSLSAIPAVNPAQLALAQESTTISAISEKVAVKVDNPSQHQTATKTLNNAAKLIGTPPVHKLSPVSAQVIINSAVTKPGELTSSPHKNESGLLLAVDQSQPGPKTVSSDGSGAVPVANAQSGQGKNAEGVQASDKTFVAAKYFTNQQSGKKLVTETPGSVRKIVPSGEKTPTTDGKSAVHKAEGSEVKPKVLVVQEKPVPADVKPVPTDVKPVPADVKPVPTDVKPVPTDVKPVPTDVKSVPAGVKPVPAGIKSADDETDIGQQDQHTFSQSVTRGEPGQMLSDSLGSNGTGSQPAGHNTSGDSILRQLNPARLQVTTGHSKNRGSSTAGNTANSDFGQIFSHDSAQTHAVEQSFISPQVVKPSGNASTPDVSVSIGAQIQGHIQNSLRQGEGEITIRLNPPELGKVFVRFQERDGQITGLLEVSKAQTRYEIEHALPQIVRNLADCGIDIKRLEVVLTDQSEQQAYKDQSLQDGSFQPHGFSEGNRQGDTPSNGWLKSDSSYQDVSEPQVQFTDDSLNMLV